MNHFKFYTPNQISSLTSVREGEVKLGETIGCTDNWQGVKKSSAKFVIIGIPEDIGVKANYGIGGTPSLWEAALKAIVNIQETDKIEGMDILILGAFDFSDLRKDLEGKPIEEWRKKVDAIDEEVFQVVQKIGDCGKIPIVIGGGHNNCYPILKGVSKAKNESVNCINLDAHSDYRRIEGRHSGNGFRYAKMDGYLKKYVAFGLDENYNSKNVIADMKADKDILTFFFETIFLHEHLSFEHAMKQAIDFVHGSSTGIEIDMDRIQNILSSAATPCGVTPLQTRQFVSHLANALDVAYLHIAEGAVELETGKGDYLTAKMVAYLVADFIKAVSNKQTVYIQTA